MQVGAFLRQTREIQNLSIRKLSGEIGVNASYVSRVERGVCNPSEKLLRRMATALSLSPPHVLTMAGFLPAEWSASMTSKIMTGMLDYDPGHGLPIDNIYSTHKRASSLRDPLSTFFGPDLIPSPELNEVYELRLARLEADILSKNELIKRGAYFIGVDGKPTNHYQICTGGGIALPAEAGSRLQSFIGTHRFKSSYATHGLFPYRGKFHPQMIKAIMNVMGMKPGQVVLDPMAGSGTTAIEANIMGINSIAVDISPFCTFMARSKVAGLSENVQILSNISANARDTEALFRKLQNDSGKRMFPDSNPGYARMSRDCLNLVGLAFMDARGYAARSTRKDQLGFFREVLSKYGKTIQRFQSTWRTIGQELGRSTVIEADARKLPIDSETIDGVVFSPPYSFAIDYVQNDLPHLEYLGCDPQELQSNLIGLRGSGPRNRAKQYFEDMEIILREVARVLKKSRYCAIIVGSNSKQLAAAFGVSADSPEARFGIESRLITISERYKLHLELAIRRLIVGMANTMREEHILFLRKEE